MTCPEVDMNARVASPGGSSSITSSSLSDEPTQLRTLPGSHPTSNGSTRAGSPSGSSSTSDEDFRQASEKHAIRNMGGLATRRGVVSLNELVLDFESDGAENINVSIPSAKRTHCTPSTPQMKSFSPPKSSSASDTSRLSPETSPLANHTHPQRPSLLRTSPMNKSVDASQRTTVFQNRLGAAAAGGDASQRSPVGRVSLGVADASQRSPLGRVSLGVAVLGSDASQRTPPGRRNQITQGLARGCVFPQPHCRNTPNSTGACLAVPSPISSQAVSMQDASERRPEASVRTPSAVPNGNSLKSWLSGVSTERSSLCDQDIAEKLLAAAPDVYED